MFWWLIFFMLLFFVPFARYALLFFIVFMVISILLAVMEVLAGARSGKSNSRVFRPKRKSKPPPWPAPKDDIEDAEFREEKK